MFDRIIVERLERNTYILDALDKQINGIDRQLSKANLKPNEITELLNARNRLIAKKAQKAKPALLAKQRAAKKRPLPRKKGAGRKRKLKAKDVEIIRSEYLSGKVSQRQLARKYGLSVSTVNEYLKGMPIKKDAYKIPKDQVFIVVNMYRSGLTMKQLAGKFNVSESTIWRTIRLRAKVSERYARKRGVKERRLRETKAAKQPAIKIDRRLSARKRKRGVKHENEGRVQRTVKSFEEIGEEGIHNILHGKIGKGDARSTFRKEENALAHKTAKAYGLPYFGTDEDEY